MSKAKEKEEKKSKSKVTLWIVKGRKEWPYRTCNNNKQEIEQAKQDAQAENVQSEISFKIA
jgi:hypothetical protein